MLADSTPTLTNFPKRGDNREISLKTSQWGLFPVAYAQDLKDNYPQIWRRGGNIRGNEQFSKLAPIARREDKKPKTQAEANAIKLREAWVARHFKDNRLPGVVAQIKWLAVGTLGRAGMRSLVEEAKQRVNKLRQDGCSEEQIDLVLSAHYDAEDMGWHFNPETGQYHKQGLYISDRQLENLMQRRVLRMQKELRRHGEKLERGEITLLQWQLDGAKILKKHHLQTFLLGRGGKGQVVDTDYLELGRSLREQYKYWRNYAIAVREGKHSPDQFYARGDLYAEASRHSFWKGRELWAKDTGRLYALRTLQSKEPCRDCPKYAGRLMILGQLPLPTQSCECKARCKCRIEFLTIEEAIARSGG